MKKIITSICSLLASLTLLFGQQNYEPNVTVSTLAGKAPIFNHPNGVAVDGIGNVYVADYYGNLIRKITPGGLISILAGSSTSGSADGQGSLASFNEPKGIAVDGIGNVYVADAGNNLIRKITPGGLVSTLAGSTTSGSADGQGSFASFNTPYGIAVDGIGNVFVADWQNHLIRKITPGGLVSTLVGSITSGSADGQGNLASFYFPAGVAVDGIGNVYVADSYNGLIRKITPGGLVSTLAGSTEIGSTDGQGNLASFYTPVGVAVDSIGNVYVADSGNNEIRKITPRGLVSTLAGSTTKGSADGQGNLASFYNPNGVAVDANGNVYVADQGNNLIRKMTPDGLVSTLAGASIQSFADGQGSFARFTQPFGVAVDGIGNVYVADTYNQLIRKITPEGLVSTLAGSTTIGSADGQGSLASFYTPVGIAVDDIGNVYVAEYGNNEIRKITPSGLVSTLAGSKASGSADGQGSLASFYHPKGIAVDGIGNVYVADQGNNLIRKMTPDGLVSTLAGSTKSGYGDGQGNLASFNKPSGITVDGIGNVYVADQGNNLIRKITPGGLVSTLVGSITSGSADGQGNLASFYFPAGVAVDGIGNVYVADAGNNLIRKMTPDGLVSTLAGSNTSGYGDGQGSLASFYYPAGVAVDGIGNVYVADAGNNEIRKITIGQTAGIVNDINSTFINIYPNPAQNSLNISLSEEVNGTISLLDMQGNTILAQSINGKTAQLNTSNIANGVYVLKVLSENASYTKQVIISK